MIDLLEAGIHRPASPACVRAERAAWPTAGDPLDVIGVRHERPGERVRAHNHVVTRVRMERHRVAIGEHATDERGSVLGDVTVDQEERRVYMFTGQHVEQVRSRRRVRTVIEGQIDGRNSGLRHVPDGTTARDRIEEKRRRGSVRECKSADGYRDKNPHTAGSGDHRTPCPRAHAVSRLTRILHPQNTVTAIHSMT